MSSDLKIEIFGFHNFYMLWSEIGFKDKQSILEIYGEECFKVNNYLEVCDVTFYIAVRCRFLAFRKTYLKDLDYDNAINWRSLSDCYDYVSRVCDRSYWFGDFTIFDKMFETCAFVMHLCSSIYKHSFIDVVNYGHLIWAMYFDKFTETFYEKGGWNELKRVATIYEGPFDFLCFMKIFTLPELYHVVCKESSVNYIQFKKAVKYDISKYKHKRTHVCKLWVKFHIEHFEEYVRIPLSYEDSVDSFEAEMLLQKLRLIFVSFYYDFEVFEILLEECRSVFSSNGISFSNTFDNGEAIKTSESLLIERIECSEMQLQSECSTLTEKIAYENIDETKNVKNSSEMKMLASESGGNLVRYSLNRCNNLPDGTRIPRFDADMENSTKIADLNCKTTNKCLDSESEKYLDEAPPRIEKRQCELLRVGKSSFSNEKDETQWNKKSPTKNLPNLIDLHSDNQVSMSYSERESSKSPMISSIYAKDGYNGSTEQSCAFSNQMALSLCERNAIPNNMSTPKDFFAVKEVMHNQDGMINPNRGLDNLREEQSDPDIRNFLRMILVLGDRQGIQYVCGTSCNSDEGRKASQVKPKKKNKKFQK